MSRVRYDKEELTLHLDGLETVADALGELARKAPATVKTAINATAREARRLMIVKAKARYAVLQAGQKHLKALAQSKKATNGSLVAELYISSFRNDLGYFEHRPRRTFTGRAVANAPEYVQAHVLKSSPMRDLKAGLDETGRSMSKGFLVEFDSGHVGMVRRHIGSSSEHTTTRKGYPRWRNARGQVEKLVTMGSPSATAMHNTVWPEVEPEVSAYLLERLERQIRATVEREQRRARG